MKLRITKEQELKKKKITLNSIVPI